MKNLIINIWKCKRIICITWIFFFLISVAGKTPYSFLQLFIFSGLFSILITIFTILFLNLKNK